MNTQFPLELCLLKVYENQLGATVACLRILTIMFCLVSLVVFAVAVSARTLSLKCPIAFVAFVVLCYILRQGHRDENSFSPVHSICWIKWCIFPQFPFPFSPFKEHFFYVSMLSRDGRRTLHCLIFYLHTYCCQTCIKFAQCAFQDSSYIFAHMQHMKLYTCLTTACMCAWTLATEAFSGKILGDHREIT